MIEITLPTIGGPRTMLELLRGLRCKHEQAALLAIVLISSPERTPIGEMEQVRCKRCGKQFIR